MRSVIVNKTLVALSFLRALLRQLVEEGRPRSEDFLALSFLR